MTLATCDAHGDIRRCPAALGCYGWFTANVTTPGELDAALARLRLVRYRVRCWPPLGIRR